MRRWKRWTLIAVGFDGTSQKAVLTRLLAHDWNYGGHREWYWTKWGAISAAKFYSQNLSVGMKPVRADELEASLAELAARS